jgi:hypothetical protein
VDFLGSLVTLVFPLKEWCRMVDSRTCVLSMSVCQHSSYIFLDIMHTCIIIAFRYSWCSCCRVSVDGCLLLFVDTDLSSRFSPSRCGCVWSLHVEPTP